MTSGGPAPIPVVVVGGYLGSGKTTLVNHLLRTGTGLRTLVLVNDFGSVAVDDEFVTSHDGRILTLANGCVCCGLSGTLSDTLRDVRALDPPPELVVVEASGVSDPRAVGHHAMVPGFALDGVVVVADAETVRRRARDKRVGRTVQRQLASADVVLLNKVDLVPDGTRQEVAGWLRAESGGAPVVLCERADVPIGLLVGAGGAPRPHSHDGDHAEHGTWSWSGADVDPVRFRAWLDGLPDGIVRVKGTVRLAGEGRRLVNRVGRRTDLAPLEDDGSPGRLVALALPGTLDATALDAGIAAAAAL